MKVTYHMIDRQTIIFYDNSENTSYQTLTYIQDKKTNKKDTTTTAQEQHIHTVVVIKVTLRLVPISVLNTQT